MKIIFSLLTFFVINSSFAANWQNSWLIEKNDVANKCTIRYEKSSLLQKKFNSDIFLTSCIDNEKDEYNEMQGNFGLSADKALEFKKECSKAFKGFSQQISCMRYLTKHKKEDNDILKACDLNADGIISSRFDYKLGRVSKNIAKKERKCKLNLESRKVTKELEEATKELEEATKRNKEATKRVKEGFERLIRKFEGEQFDVKTQ
jgi:hypothetical protein